MILSSQTKKIFAGLGLVMFYLPAIVLAQTVSPPSTPSSNTGIVYECTSGAAGECTFNELLLAVQKVTKWGAIFALAFSVIVIAWAGFNLMVYGENSSKRKEASTMLWKVVQGIAFILLAWLIVTLITKGLLLKPNVPQLLKP